LRLVRHQNAVCVTAVFYGLIQVLETRGIRCWREVWTGWTGGRCNGRRRTFNGQARKSEELLGQLSCMCNARWLAMLDSCGPLRCLLDDYRALSQLVDKRFEARGRGLP
jgi:hypothetical protein